jgi:SNF2 family DNA or RNA helicase
MSCISSYFNSKTGKSGECPCCRNKIGFEGITIVDDEVSANNILSSNIKPKKEDLFIKLILDEKGGVQKKKWLVFSNYDATFQGLIERLEQCGVVFSKINGTVTHIDRVIKDFGDGKIQVLLLNAKQFGMGLNLQMATDILIYHQLDRELEKQVIGRAQRPGRIGALNVHYLCHDNELYYYNSHILNMKLVNLQDKILEI